MIIMRSNLSRAINGCKESVDLFCFLLHRIAEKVNIKTSTNPTVLLNDKGQSAWIRPEFFNSIQIVLNVSQERGNRFFKACRKPVIKIPPDTCVPHTDCSFSKTNCCCKCQENSMIEAQIIFIRSRMDPNTLSSRHTSPHWKKKCNKPSVLQMCACKLFSFSRENRTHGSPGSFTSALHFLNCFSKNFWEFSTFFANTSFNHL